MVSNSGASVRFFCNWSPLEEIPRVWHRGALAPNTSLYPPSNLNLEFYDHVQTWLLPSPLGMLGDSGWGWGGGANI